MTTPDAQYLFDIAEGMETAPIDENGYTLIPREQAFHMARRLRRIAEQLVWEEHPSEPTPGE